MVRSPVLRSPDLGDQLIMGHNRIHVPGQFGQYRIFRSGKMQICFADKYPPRVQINQQLANLDFGIEEVGGRIRPAQKMRAPAPAVLPVQTVW